MKYGKKRLFLPLTVLALLILFPLSIKLFAQSTNNYDVTISPIFFDLSADPNTNITSKIKIRNNTTSPIPLKLGVQKLSGDTNGNLNLKQDQNDYTLSWIKFSQDSIVAKPLEWTEIPFTVEVPKDAAYGYYWTITFTQDKTSPLARTGVNLTGSAGVPILLNVRKAGAKAEAKILDFSAKTFISEYLPVDFNVKVQNLGNVHIRPHGNIFISDGRNKDLAILDVNSSLGNIIPNSARIFSPSWFDGFIVRQPIIEDGQAKVDKDGKVIETLQINWNKLTSFRIGKYTANLLLVYDNGKKDIPMEATISFWVLPYKVMILMAISIIVAFFVIKLLLRIYIGREVKRRIGSR